MAESFLMIVADKVLGQIISSVGAASYWGLNSDLKKLQNTINNVKAVILDAEEAQLTSHEVCTWLAQLKDVLFDAEDVFDEFAYEHLRKQLVNSPIHGGTRKKVRRFLSTSSNPIAFRLRMSRKVRDVREAFDEVAANRAKFHLNPHRVFSNNSTDLLLNKRELTHSFVDSSQIIGRDADRDAILDSLISNTDASVSVVSIVGIGGLGKTALAKMVFNDSRVDDHFENKVWVCLGDLNEFNVNRVMVKLVKSITGRKGDDSDPEELQCCLRDNLHNKKFLLVLDDVWDADRGNWLELRQLLVCGANGSKVLVTTRDSSVASNMGSILEHSLSGLGHDECVSLFKKFAFEEGEDNKNLMSIGDVIVKKCVGVPLAIKTLGLLLFSKKSTADWVFIRDNDIWKIEQKKNDIMQALKISYNQLPFILKQCFLYCSIFQKDHEFDSHKLIGHWSSYGLLRSSGERKRADDIGQQYIYQLCVRGFFQEFEEIADTSTFRMHDLFHDLALSVTQNELISMRADRQRKDMYNSIRHVSFSKSEGLGGEEVTKLFMENSSRSSCVMPTIWSVSFDETRDGADSISQLVKTCISELKHLRIMDLSYSSSLDQLPRSIGALKHLRFLDLDECKRLKRLPDSICQLYNLHTLLLCGCVEFEELPKDIGDLVELRRLSITTKQKRLSEGIGNGIESLRFLQDLRLYGCDNLEYIFESGTNDDTYQQPLLTSVRMLVIFSCKSLTCLLPSIPSPSMKKSRELSSLEFLSVLECPNVDLASVFNDQIRLVRLRCLLLFKSSQMESLPEWISEEGCASTLEVLMIGDFPNLASLPEWLSNLTSLRQLTICKCPKVLCMPCVPFALRELEILDCPELSRRCAPEIGEDWPKIKHIPNIFYGEDYQL